MADATEIFTILQVAEEGKTNIEAVVARECSLTIILNNRELVILLCSPINLEYLAVGFLSSEGLIKGKDEINKIALDEEQGMIRVEIEEDRDFAGRLIASSGARGAAYPSIVDVQSQIMVKTEISASEVLALVEDFEHRSPIYRATGGVHSAALCSRDGILIFSEDIGRHNAIDKIFGECILKDTSTAERIIITSGRISSEILVKVAKRDIPIIISLAVPTDVAVRLATDLGLTIIGRVRGKKMNVYTEGWRVIAENS